jgi:hypothetical protein
VPVCVAGGASVDGSSAGAGSADGSGSGAGEARCSCVRRGALVSVAGGGAALEVCDGDAASEGLLEALAGCVAEAIGAEVDVDVDEDEVDDERVVVREAVRCGALADALPPIVRARPGGIG